MIRRPPRSTRTDTLFPYTTLFRSTDLGAVMARIQMPDVVRRKIEQMRKVQDVRSGLLLRAAIMPVVDSIRPNSDDPSQLVRSEEHTSELQSLMRISYAVFCLKKKTQTHTNS